MYHDFLRLKVTFRLKIRVAVQNLQRIQDMSTDKNMLEYFLIVNLRIHQNF
jgi:hypothetical protein